MKTLNFLIKPASGLCNMRCRYCFYEDEAANRSEANVGRMTEATADRLIEDEQLSVCLERVLDGRELQVICERYGLLGRKERTQREIAKELGISRSYVSRIEKRAVERLREEFAGEEGTN